LERGFQPGGVFLNVRWIDGVVRKGKELEKLGEARDGGGAGRRVVDTGRQGGPAWSRQQGDERTRDQQYSR